MGNKLLLKTRGPVGKILKGVLVLWFLCHGLIAHAALFDGSADMLVQTRIITGQVLSSEDGQPLPGVSVVVKGTTNGAATDTQGNFSLSVNNDAILVFTFIGYTTQEVPVGNKSKIDVRLVPDQKQLEEVVVVGYGTVKKSDLTGSVVSLKASELTPGANVNVQQQMQGRAAGVQISQRTGEPGAGMSVKIRGVSSISAGNDPLYVIDGMPVNDAAPVAGTGAGFVANPNPRNPLNSLNPSDIESIEILKDASATAIYGSRGANGVVIITTKRGAAGKMKVGYNTYYGIQEVANSNKMLTAQQYHDVLNSIIDDGGGNASERVSDDFEADTDWQAELYQKASTQSHDLSFSGGSENSRYYVSLGYFDQEGIVKNSGIKRYSARVNLDNKVNEKYGFGVNINASYMKDLYNSSGLGVNENSSAIYSAIYYDPTAPVYNPDGSYHRSIYMTMDNPVAVINGQTANSDSYRTFGTAYGEYFFVPSLSAKVKIGADFNTSQRNVWVDPSTINGMQYNGLASILTGTRTYYMGEATLNFNKTFGDHSVNAVGGTTYEYFGSSNFTGSGRGFSLPDLTYNAIGSGDPTLNQIGSGRASTILASYLGRVNYVFKNTYLLTVSMRADGSSRFGPNNRFGFFPSAAVAWKLQEEPFMKDLTFISELKLRASYGAIGNQSIANYLYIPTFVNGPDAVFGNTRYNSISPSRNPNPDLKWEAAVQTDIGVDFAFLNNRFRGSIEYYRRKTTDLLLNVPQPLSSGFNVRTQNVGSMQNTGWDMTLSTHLLKRGDFEWNLDGNFSILKNEVLDLGPSPFIIAGGAGQTQNVGIIIPGQPIFSYYGYEVLGVWQTGDDFSEVKDNVKPGDVKYKDQDGDGTITDDDRVILGKPFPDYTYGITNTFNYKTLSFSFFVEGAQGGSILNAAMIDAFFPVSFRRNKVAEPYLNRWTPENPTNEYPSFVNPTSQGQRVVNSRTVEDASYVRLQSVRLSYGITIKQNKFINALNVYVTGQNLFTITDYSGIDPALNAGANDILKIDYSSYPFARVYMMGLNVEF